MDRVTFLAKGNCSAWTCGTGFQCSTSASRQAYPASKESHLPAHEARPRAKARYKARAAASARTMGKARNAVARLPARNPRDRAIFAAGFVARRSSMPDTPRSSLRAAAKTAHGRAHAGVNQRFPRSPAWRQPGTSDGFLVSPLGSCSGRGHSPGHNRGSARRCRLASGRKRVCRTCRLTPPNVGCY